SEAQTKTFTIEQEFARRFPADSTSTCTFSPDGQWVAIVTTSLGAALISNQERIESGIEGGLEGSKVELVSTASGERVEVNKAGCSFGPVWSPGGDRLAFVSTQDGRPAVWVWDRSSKVSHRVQGTIVGGLLSPWSAVAWSPDGRKLLVQLTEQQ